MNLSIKERIAYLIESQKLQNKSIVLVASSVESRQAAAALLNMGITPAGIIEFRPEDFPSEFLWGIPIFSFNSFYKKFKNKAVILMLSVDYPNLHLWFSCHGYFLNHNIFMDFQDEDLAVKAHKKNHIEKFFFHLPILNRFVRKLFYATQSVIKGYRVYIKIIQQYGFSTPIYVYDYTGMGDTYVFCCYLKANIHGPYVVTLIGNANKKVAIMCGVQNVLCLTQEESQHLASFQQFIGEYLHVYAITPLPLHAHTDILSSIYGRRLNMAQAYCNAIFNNVDKRSFHPISFPEYSDSVNCVFRDNNLIPKNTVILSPYANTVVGYDQDFWKELASLLQKMGFCVVTNAVGKEPTIPGTYRLEFTLKDSGTFINTAGYFIGLRSGFCDVISNTSALKIILYPKMEKYNFNSSIFSFCSFELMGFGKNYKEICWGYKNLELLRKKIIKALVENK